MSFLNPLTWSRDYFLLRDGNGAGIRRLRNERIALACVYLTTSGLSALWLAHVTKYVPEQYLDEVFHIPQAQAYCRGEFNVWDPKLTTPPGLYIVSTFLIRLIRGGSCTVMQLRATNCLTLLLVLPAAHACRRAITKGPAKKYDDRRDADDSTINWDAVHTAANICLFPPLFFFSGLYYTDVLSTFVVIKAYDHFLQGQDKQAGSLSRGVLTFGIGAIALLMRQTNIFWVAVFMGGLELARSFHHVRSNAPGLASQHEPASDSMKTRFGALTKTVFYGGFHDPRLEQADPLDFLWCAMSLLAVSIGNPIRVAGRLWPYFALLLSFGGFVLWNRGVVLGDKSNHVATIHLPQMLYIWPFMAFFSLPLLISTVTQLVFSFLGPLKWWTAQSPEPGRPPQIFTLWWLLVGSLMAIGVIHLNTIIHPFTLADNRHYVFYVFRYSIRRHPMVKYILAPVYLSCAFLILRTLAGYYPPRLDTTAGKGKDGSPKSLQPGESAQSDSLSESSIPSTSFTLIWLISTALSLITAPLVEPRYFIIPWVIWRLHVPALPLTFDVELSAKGGNTEKQKQKMSTSTSCWAGWMKYWSYEGHDYRLWLETSWFLLISLITGSIFLFKGFEWAQEPDKVQRFMW